MSKSREILRSVREAVNKAVPSSPSHISYFARQERLNLAKTQEQQKIEAARQALLAHNQAVYARAEEAFGAVGVGLFFSRKVESFPFPSNHLTSEWNEKTISRDPRYGERKVLTVGQKLTWFAEKHPEDPHEQPVRYEIGVFYHDTDHSLRIITASESDLDTHISPIMLRYYSVVEPILIEEDMWRKNSIEAFTLLRKAFLHPIRTKHYDPHIKDLVEFE